MKQLLIQIALVTALFIPNHLNAQNWEYYKTSKPSNRIPEEFLLSSTEKFEKQSGNVMDEKKTTLEASDRFLLESNFSIDQLLLSGKVLFNEPISDYLNQVANKILEHDSILRKKLRFYVIKSPIPNAFATGMGSFL